MLNLFVMLLKSGVILVLLFVVGLLMEKLFYKEKNLEQLVHQLKFDIARVIKALFSKKTMRHIFEPQFVEDLKSVVREYALSTFDIDVFNNMYNGSPTIAVCFVPKSKLEIEQLEEASKYVLMKFTRYLMIHNLDWQSFVTYRKIDDYVHIYIFYAEFPEDIDSYNNNHKQAVKEKSDVDFGAVQDDDLNKELDDVS